MDAFAFLLLQIINGSSWNPEFGQSTNYKNWISRLDLKTCTVCRKMHGQVWNIYEIPEQEPKVHPNCRCQIKIMVTVKAGTATTNKKDGADWMLKYESKLPSYYTKLEEALKNGWEPGKWVSNFVPGKMLIMVTYDNEDGHLPSSKERIWYEADINYKKGKRNSQRILWSNDGLIFVTYDHYRTFFEIV